MARGAMGTDRCWSLDSGLCKASLWGTCCLLGNLTSHGSYVSQCEGDLGTIGQISILMANKFDERVTFTVDSENGAHGENNRLSLWDSGMAVEALSLAGSPSTYLVMGFSRRNPEVHLL